MTTLKLGAAGPDVFPIALGCMGMGGRSWYGPSDDAESIATIQHAIDRGVNVLDTGDFYGLGRNEMLVGKAIAGRRRDQVLLSVKYGLRMGPDGTMLGLDTSPIGTKAAVAYSLARLGVDHIDIYRGALDPNVPIEDTVGAIADLIKAGYVRYASLSEVGAETIRAAAKVHPITDVQLEYSLASRSTEAKIWPTLRELGVGLTAYGVLSRGMLTGTKPSAGDYRSHMPRFTGDNAAKNRTLAEALAQLATERGATAAQLAIAWARAKGAAAGIALVPVVGARTRVQLDDALGALTLTLSEEDLAQLERAVPAEAVAGARYPEAMLAGIDSER